MKVLFSYQNNKELTGVNVTHFKHKLPFGFRMCCHQKNVLQHLSYVMIPAKIL